MCNLKSNMNFKKWMSAGMICMFANFCFAQITFTGTVKNETGEQLAGVIVQLENTMLATTTDAEGRFSLGRLKAGNYGVKLNLLGYETKSEKIDLEAPLEQNYVLIKKSYVADEVIISSTRVNEKSAMAYNTLTKKEIEENNLGRDVPALLDQLPGIVTTSDAGAGVGYTGIRIRGSDATRVNVTINGIPINDAESQAMYWVDMPDLLTSVEDIQIQRGVGTSTNGAAAFGGSVNVFTDKLHTEPYAESSIGYGSFNTQKANIKAGTGLIKNKFSIEARLSKIKSDGYIDRASSDLNSFMVSAGYYGKKSLLKFVLYSGKEITYQSWNGTPESRINNDENGMQDFISRNLSYEDDIANLLNSGRTYNFYTYENQVDNFRQDNYQLHFSQEINSCLLFNAALHMTRGLGYYEEYKRNASFSSYGLNDVIIGSDTITETNLIRRKWLDNYFYGATYSIKYQKEKWQSILGGAWNQYDGDHYGKIIWSQYASNSEINHRYYFNNGLKTDFNIFLKPSYDITSKLNVWIDLQYRNISYEFEGFDNTFNSVPQKINYRFFNPKAGITYQRNSRETAYASVSVGNKEPSRDDFTDSSPLSRPKSENLKDIEAGYKFTSKRFTASLNLYYMWYKNQLILTGQVNDVGNYTRANIKSSYREGVEVEAAYSILGNIKIAANASLSENKIKDYSYFLDTYDAGFNYTGQSESVFKNTDIAFSPSLVAAGSVSYNPIRNFKLTFTEKYVGKQFLDNTSDDGKSLDAFSYTNLAANCTIHLKSLKEISLVVTVYNLFNQLYESNGYTYGYRFDNQVVNENFYYPQAGANFMAQVTLKF